jgi:hypothetical protein
MTAKWLHPDNRHAFEYKGVKYKSYTEAGLAFGLDPTVVKDRLAKGYPLEERRMNRAAARRK